MVDAPARTGGARVTGIAAGVVAQSCAGVATLMLAVVVARNLGLTELGVFSLISATIAVVLGVVRSLSTELVVFRDDRSIGAFGVRLCKGATSANAVLGVVGGAAIALSALLFDGAAAALVVAGALTPAAIMQDHCRFILIHEGRSRSALGVDAIYLGIQAIGLIVVAGSRGLAGYLLVWLIAAAASAMVGLRLCSTTVSVVEGVRWIRLTWRGGRVFLADFAATNGVMLGANYVVSAFGGVAAVGALRGAQILLTPLQLVLRGGMVALGSEASRLGRDGRLRSLVRLAVGYAVAGAVGSVVVVAAMLIAPDPLVEALIGESTAAAREVLPFAGAANAALCVAMGAGLALRAVGQVGRAVRVKLAAAPAAIVLVALGSWAGGAAGSQAALAIAESGRAAAGWWEFTRWKAVSR